MAKHSKRKFKTPEALWTLAEEKFSAIQAKLIEQEGVSAGTMMSHPSIKYLDKNFAFIHEGIMIFRLGRDFEPESFGIKKWDLLNPFESKPPMKDWFEFPYEEIENWDDLAVLALEKQKV